MNTMPLTDEEVRQIEARFKESELRYRSDMQFKVDKLLLAEEDRKRKYDPFIDILIEREREKAELRRAIIKHGTIVALGAVALFVLNSMVHEMSAIVAAIKR